MSGSEGRSGGRCPPALVGPPAFAVKPGKIRGPDHSADPGGMQFQHQRAWVDESAAEVLKLKREIKEFEHQFKEARGRAPSKDDVKGRPDIRSQATLFVALLGNFGFSKQVQEVRQVIEGCRQGEA